MAVWIAVFKSGTEEMKELQAYWKSVLPANRGYTFYYTLATSARSAGDRQAALLLLREGVEVLKDFRYRQLEALALSDLGAWESEEGNFDTAHAVFTQMEQLFNHLEREGLANSGARDRSRWRKRSYRQVKRIWPFLGCKS